MAIQQTTKTATVLADRWWVALIRGIAAILFGVFALAFPTISLLTLILVWASYTLVDGVFSLVMATRRGRRGESWGWLMFGGVVGIATSALAFAWPGMTALILLTVIAGWAMLTGLAELAAAIRLRKVIDGEWLLAASGVLSLVFGGLMFAYPGAGALALLGIISGYAIVFGVLMLGLARRLYGYRGSGSGRRMIPGGGMPTPSSAT